MARKGDVATMSDPRSWYDAIGGHEAFERLTTKFYEQVAADPEFRAMYPEEDLEPARVRLRMFLEQYWGGPTTYQEQRGHPRLRARHMPFPVTIEARDTWLRYMRVAMDELVLSPELDAIMWDYFSRAAAAMVNTGPVVQQGLNVTPRHP